MTQAFCHEKTLQKVSVKLICNLVLSEQSWLFLALCQAVREPTCTFPATEAVFRLTRLQYTDAQWVGCAVGHRAPGAIVILPIKQGSTLVRPRLLASSSGDAEAEVGVSGCTIHCGTCAQAQQLVAPLQSAIPRECHQISEFSIALCWLEPPSDCSRNVWIVPWLDDALQVKRVTKRHARCTGGGRHEEERF